MRESLKRIEEEFKSFFEFPTDDKSSITSVSCKLFAEHCVENISKQYENEIEDKNFIIKDLFEKNSDKRGF